MNKKNKTFPDNRPALTVMIQARTPKRIEELIKRGVNGGADAFGIQLEQLEKKYRTEKILNDLFSQVGDKPLYITDYRSNLNVGTEDVALAEEILAAVSCGADLADVMGDLFCQSPLEITYEEIAVKKQKSLISEIHKCGCNALMSSHTYKYLPPEKVIEMAETHHSRGADIAKIVTAAENRKDLASNFEISAKLLQKLDIPFLFLCVGSFSTPHRRIAPLINNGMFLCVVEHDELSTPAQPLLSDALKIVNSVCL